MLLMLDFYFLHFLLLMFVFLLFTRLLKHVFLLLSLFMYYCWNLFELNRIGQQLFKDWSASNSTVINVSSSCRRAPVLLYDWITRNSEYQLEPNFTEELEDFKYRGDKTRMVTRHLTIRLFSLWHQTRTSSGLFSPSSLCRSIHPGSNISCQASCSRESKMKSSCVDPACF